MLLAVSIVLNVIFVIVLVSIAISRASQPHRAERTRLVEPIRSLPEIEDVLEDTVSFDAPDRPEDQSYTDDGLAPEELPTSSTQSLEQLAAQAVDPVYVPSAGVDLTDHGPASLEAGGERRKAYTFHAQHKAKGEVYGDCEFCVSEPGGVPTPG